MWSKFENLTTSPQLKQGVRLLVWWAAFCSLALLLIIAAQCDSYRLTTFGPHRINQSQATGSQNSKQAKITAKPLLFTPDAEHLRFVVAIEKSGADANGKLSIGTPSLQDNRQKQYRYPQARLGGLTRWEEEALAHNAPQDGKTELALFTFAPPVPDAANLESFHLKFVAKLEREGKKSRITTSYPFDLAIRKGEIEQLRMFNLLPRTSGLGDGLARLKAHARHFRRDLAGTVYVHLVSLWGLLGSFTIVALFLYWRQRRKQPVGSSAASLWPDDFDFDPPPNRMKHYRLGIAVVLLLGAVVSGIVLLAKSFGRRGGGTIVQNQPVILSTPWPTPLPVETVLPTPMPTPEPTPAPQPYVKQIGNTEWRVYVPIEAGWYDTGIPVITNKGVSIGSQNGRWQVQLGQQAWYNKQTPGSSPWMDLTFTDNERFIQCCTDYDFHDTIKLRVAEESDTREILFLVELKDLEHGSRRKDPSHMALHQPYIEWYNEKLQRVLLPLANATPEPVAAPSIPLPAEGNSDDDGADNRRAAGRTQAECEEMAARKQRGERIAIPPDCQDLLKKSKKPNQVVEALKRIGIEAADRAVRRIP